MTDKIFLQGSRSKKATNTSSGINIQLRGKTNLLPTEDVEDTINLYDLYTEERKACSTIRLTCQVNPICSNVLFNRVSEIIKDEGSSSATFINYGVGNGLDEGAIEGKRENMSFWSGNSLGYTSKFSESDSTKELSSLVSGYNPTINAAIENSDSMHCTNALRDSQLSNKKLGFMYHCGLDVFNNHLLRSNTFKCVCKVKDDNKYQPFNTIADMMRDARGHCVIEKIPFPIEANYPNGSKYTPLHLYEIDDILTFDEAVEGRLIKGFDGWVGFENTSKIKTYSDFANGTEMEIERPIMNSNACDFVDMYPDRGLYSFVPKYNKFKNRIEKNWNYCITYPMSSTTEGFDDIIDTTNGLNSLKTIYYDEITRGDNGVRQLVMYGIVKHGLNVGDYVNVYKTFNGEVTLLVDSAEVTNVVDDFIFTVANPSTQISRYWVEFTDDELASNRPIKLGNLGTFQRIDDYFVETSGNTVDDSVHYYLINGSYANLDDEAQNVSFKKVVNGIECDYYVRVFSKLPNFKYASGDTSNEYEIYKKSDSGLPLVDEYKKKEYDFENHVSKLAFAKNIYSDEVGQVVFTDDINIANIHDNLGRPLTSLYLTILKNNKGYKEWYGYGTNGAWEKAWVNSKSDNIEFSHCFGKLNCAFETSDESVCDQTIRSVKTIHNVNGQSGYVVDNINNGRTYADKTVSLENDEIWYDTDVNFYGDLCYYDGYNALEVVIQPMMYRFNTAQRECAYADSADYFKSFVHDEIEADDYDIKVPFAISAYTVDEANMKKEGYYYNPHYEIPIKTFDKLQSVLPTFLTIRSIRRIESNVYQIATLQEHFLSIGDKAVIYDTIRNVYYNCVTIDSGEGDNYKVFTCQVFDYDGGEDATLKYLDGNGNEVDLSSLDSSNQGENLNLRTYKLFKTDNLAIPSYATLLRDGTCRFIWRNVLNNGFNKSDDTIEEYPFTNGAFYINKRIDMYVKRQDPYNQYGLYSEDDVEGSEPNVTVVDNSYYTEEDIQC